MSAVTTDGIPHEIQLYTDISAEWITGNNSLNATWSTNIGDIITHQVQLQDQSLFTEVADHIQCENYPHLFCWSIHIHE